MAWIGRFSGRWVFGIGLRISIPILLASGAVLRAQPVADQVGFTDLINRYGVSLPDGSGVSLLVTEVSPYPDTSAHPSPTYIQYSGAGPVSGHATTILNLILNQVPGVPTVGLMSANDFVGDLVLQPPASLPILPSQTPPIGVVNASWIGTSGDVSGDAFLLALTDYFVDVHGVSVVGGVNNTSGIPSPLTGQAYNTLAVGVSTPGGSSDQPSNVAGSGRAIVDLVVPESTTSSATAWVSAAALLLMDGALENPELVDAADPRVVRSLLMTSAAKLPGWERGAPGAGDDTTVPLDYQFGAGELRVNRAYDLLLNGQMSPGEVASNMGWSLETLGESPDTYIFNHSGDDFFATLAWNREARLEGENIVMAHEDLNLELFSVGPGDVIGSLMDASLSEIDNVEHIYYPGLVAGRYAVRVTGAETFTYSLAFMPIPEPGTWGAIAVILGIVGGRMGVRWMRNR